MPTPKSTDDIPMVQNLVASGGGVSALTYLEARLKDLREAMGIEVQGLREMQLRFREDTMRAREDMQEAFEKQAIERDVRYSQRFDASQQALSAAMIASEKAINAALTSAAQAVTKAELANEARFSCVEASTPILCADGSQREAGELLVGDKLLAFDEDSHDQFQIAVVTHNAIHETELLEVTTQNGCLRCALSHPLLVSGRWIEARDLRIGDFIALVDSKRHQTQARGASDLGSFKFAREVAEIGLLPVDLYLGVPRSVLPERDSPIPGCRAAVAGFVLHVEPAFDGSAPEIGTPAVEAVPVDVVTFKTVARSQAKDAPMQAQRSPLLPLAVDVGDGIAVAEVPTMLPGERYVGDVDDSVGDDHALAVDGHQRGAVVLGDWLASAEAACLAAMHTDRGLDSQETGATLAADARNAGSILSGHRLAPRELGVAPPAVCSSAGVFSLSQITSISRLGQGRIAELSTTTKTYLAHIQDGVYAASHNSVNEFRQTLSDQTASFIPRAEADARFVSIAEKLEQLSSRMDKRDGTGTGLSAGWGILVSVIGLAGTIFGAAMLLSK